MSWRIKEITSAENGTISAIADITHIIGNFTIDQTLGDEMTVQGGDITLKHREPFTGDWLIFYFNEQVIDAFRIKKPYDKINQKFSHRYESRLESIQKIFFDWLGECPVNYVTDPDDINYAISNGAANFTIKELDFIADDIHHISNDVYGFSLVDMIKSVSGIVALGYTNKYNFCVDTVNSPGPVLNENNLPMLYRGDGISIVGDLSFAIDFYFKTYPVYWLDIFKLAVHAFYSFIRVTPKIKTVGASEKIAVDVNIIPKINISPADVLSSKWLERDYIPEQGRIDKIRLYSAMDDKYNNPSFDLNLGIDSTQGVKVYEKKIFVANQSSDFFYPPEHLEYLFLTAGNYLPGESKYEVASDYFISSLITPYYSGVLGEGYGNGYSGKIRFNGERAGNHIYTGSDVVQIYRLTINRDDAGAVASVEGLKIA